MEGIVYIRNTTNFSMNILNSLNISKTEAVAAVVMPGGQRRAGRNGQQRGQYDHQDPFHS